jgi:hypothetical protein
MIINYESTIGPIVTNKCQSCHTPVIVGTDTTLAGNLDLTAVPDTTRENRIFPRAYVNLSGETMMMSTHQVTDPPFPRRSILIDAVLGVGTRSGMGAHGGLTPEEKRQFNLWVLLGAQYK